MTTSSSTESGTEPLKMITSAVGTDVGRRREENQDSFGIIENAQLKFVIVADGMGGAKGGAIASNLAVRTIESHIASQADFDIKSIVSSIRQANSAIYEKGSSEESLAGMGTTFVGLLFHELQMYVLNVGDSRAYRVRNGVIKQLTHDHTLIRELLDSGAITAEQAENHPVAHMLTRSLGPTPDIEVDCMLCTDGPARGDIYVLCSDGLYNLVSAKEIAVMTQEYSVDEAVEHLINLANERGGTDNITVIVLEIEEGYPVGPERFPEEREELIEMPAPKSALKSDQPLSDSDRRDSSVNPAEGATPRPQMFGAINGSAAGHLARELRTDQGTDAKSAAQPAAEMNAALQTGMPATRSARSLSLVVVGVLLGVLATSYLPGYLGGEKGTGPEERVLVNPLATSIAKASVELYSSSAEARLPEPQAPEIQKFSSDQDKPDAHATVAGADGGQGYQEPQVDHLASLRLKLESLLKQATELDRKIATFAGPLSGAIGERLKAAESEHVSLKENEVKLRSDLEQATRKLSIWFGRKQRVQRSDPVDIASEIAVSSESVRDRKDLFERATWAYLKEVELWQYNQADAELTKNVSRLGRVREQRLRELSAEIRRVMDQNIAISEGEIAQATSKIDQNRLRIDELDREIAYAKVLTGSNPEAKDRLRKELEQERDHARAEIEELQKLLPAEAVADSDEEGAADSEKAAAGNAKALP